MKINILDLIGTILILLGLYLVGLNSKWWLLYGTGCITWVYICYIKKLYFGMIMNIVAMIIALINFIKG